MFVTNYTTNRSFGKVLVSTKDYFFFFRVASSESIEAWIRGNVAVKSKAIVKAKEFSDTRR